MKKLVGSVALFLAGAAFAVMVGLLVISYHAPVSDLADIQASCHAALHNPSEEKACVEAQAEAEIYAQNLTKLGIPGETELDRDCLSNEPVGGDYQFRALCDSLGAHTWIYRKVFPQTPPQSQAPEENFNYPEDNPTL